jgi:hypothetical protein
LVIKKPKLYSFFLWLKIIIISLKFDPFAKTKSNINYAD